MNRAFVKEFKKGKIRLWIMKEGELHSVYFYHENFPLPVDKELVKDLETAEKLCLNYLNPETDGIQPVAV